MRVLHISNDYYNSGVYQTLHRGFLQHGLDSVFFVPMRYDDPPRGFPGVLEAHCFHKRDRYLYMNKQRKIYREFRGAVEQQKPDLLHGYFLFSGGIHCLWAKREFGIPYTITVQDTDINTIYRWLAHLRGLGWEILREASMIFFVSDAYQAFVMEHFVPADDHEKVAQKCRILPFAVDPFWTAHADSSPHPPHDGPIRLLTVGVVNRRKNQRGTVEAVRLLEQQGIAAELTVIGAAEDATLDREICKHGFVRRIQKLPKEELIAEYRRADLFVLPSLTESFGLVYAEALSQGLPVLYSAGQGFDKQFPEGYVGYHVDARAPKNIASCIQTALQEYNALQEHCGNAVTRFSQAAVCAESEVFYREAMSVGRV